MASPLYIAQQVFSAYTASNLNQGALECVNGTASNSTLPSATSAALPTDVSSLFSFFLSFSALREWFKLFVLGSVLESLRRFALYLYHRVYNSFFVTAHLEDGDTSYYRMMIWLSKRPEWKQARDVQVTSRTYGVNPEHLAAPAVDGEPFDESVRLVPAEHTSLSFFAHGSWIRATRTFRESQWGNREESLELRIFSWRKDILYKLLSEAKKSYESAQENTISIYSSDIHNNWRLIASRPKRPLNSIFLDPGIKNLLVDDARDFLDSKAWYAARGIPFRRGYLLYGAPGSGKTSIIHSLAGELELDVYIISLSRSLLDDTALADLISDLPEKCIALMEDIDAAFDQNLNRGDLDKENESNNAKNGDTNKKTQMAAPTSKVTLSGLLNALDGVGAQEGRILFATTNRYTSLDPALTRPGRMDIHVHFRLASKYQARELYRCFYHPESEAKEREQEGSSEKAKDKAEKGKSESDLDSGYSSTDEKERASSIDFTGASHRSRAPKLSAKQVAALAMQFAEAIPQRELSMASLQGYLMTYKVRPYEAVKDAPAWVEKQRAAKAEREAKLKAAEEEAKAAAAKTESAPTPAPTSEIASTPTSTTVPVPAVPTPDVKPVSTSASDQPDTSSTEAKAPEAQATQ
ncbi:P-loop containing nucleoside triphosphate hydrolase protein [Agrocybe pediades]|nr:P-loop containing nucleoside triphosphate hydrolase protein [Agrocybe pediades]